MMNVERKSFTLDAAFRTLHTTPTAFANLRDAINGSRSSGMRGQKRSVMPQRGA
jgi:hypothetical protein